MRPAEPQSEDQMQALVASHPELIADGDGQLLLIKREKPVADSFDNSGRWALDHLFVTRGAIPVLVELKRASNSKLRREVVGQMMDYAANAVAYWRAGHILETFISTCKSDNQDPDEVLAAFIDDKEPESFWAEVDANIEGGRLKLVFVADVIPPELAQIVEFLNSQMKADVRAIELNWFAGNNGTTTLVPRVIGETQIAAARKRTHPAPDAVTREEWIGKFIQPKGSDAVRGAFAYIEAMETIGCRTEVATLQGSIVTESDGDNGKPFYPFHLWQNGSISLSYKWLWKRRGLADESTRMNFILRFSEIFGPLSTQNVRGFPAFKASLLVNPEKQAAFISLGREFVEAARLV